MEAEARGNSTETTNASLDKGCPMCGGAMEFEPATGMLHCPFCEHRMPVDANPAEVCEQVFNAATHVENFMWGQEQKQIICQSCGASAVYDALQTSAVCPFCGSTHVLPEAVDTSMPPNGVCPFVITREAAGVSFKKWLKKRIFAPSKAKKSVSPGSFNGMYIPYWTFDSQTSTPYTAKYGKTHRDSKGNSHTVWRNTSGVWNMFIDDAAVPGTTKHNSGTLGKIEPYDTHAAVPYRPEFLAGFVSERYSVGLNDAWASGKKKMEGIISGEIKKNVKKQYHADRVEIITMFPMFNNLTYKYMLLPLWQSSFSYKSKKYDFMVNGQTGKVAGKSPVSALRVVIAVILALILAALIFFVMENTENDVYYQAPSPFEFTLCLNTRPSSSLDFQETPALSAERGSVMFSAP